MPTDKSRHARDIRYGIILDNGEDATRWSDSGYLTASGITTSTTHITGQKSISFNKFGQNSTGTAIWKRLGGTRGIDLDNFSVEGQIFVSTYFSSISDISTLNVFLFEDGDNLSYYTLAASGLSAGWNNVKFNCIDGNQLGTGVNWGAVKYVGVGATLSAASATLSGILVDSVRVQIPQATVEFSASIDNVHVTSEVQIKDGDGSDELSVNAANSVRSTATNVIPVQPIDQTGKVSPAGDTNSNAPFVKLTDGTNDWALDAANTSRTTSTLVLPVQNIDSEGKVLRSGADSDSPVYTQDVGGGSGGGGGNMLYISPEDFTATYASASGITLAGLAWLPSIEQFVSVTKFDSAGLSESFTPSTNDFDYNSSTGVLNVGNTPGFAATDGGYRVQLYGPDKAYSKPEDSEKSYVVNQVSKDYSYVNVASVTNEADASTPYYVDMDGYAHCVLQYDVTGGTDKVDLSVHGSVQSDGTAPGSCTYQDITENGMDILTWTTTSGSYNLSTILKTKDGSSWKYLKCLITKTGGSNDADYIIRAKLFY